MGGTHPLDLEHVVDLNGAALFVYGVFLSRERGGGVEKKEEDKGK
jgi:hypothetical protein